MRVSAVQFPTSNESTVRDSSTDTSRTMLSANPPQPPSNMTRKQHKNAAVRPPMAEQ